ncbi:hypothetical protein [Aquimarina macrocephali]|uniref:hypothetical protein n=1 Tax=Aquimarina macrocephali TaxID=666563 RepID=UPI003F6613A9
MATFLQAQQKAKRQTPQKIKSELFRFIRTLEKELADVNVNRLHDYSQDVDGNPIGFYSPGTESITNGRKKEGQPFDLKDTGEFLESLFSEVRNDSIFFDTKDEKKKEVLINLLSKDIFGLTDEDLREVIDSKISPFFLKYLRKNLHDI